MDVIDAIVGTFKISHVTNCEGVELNAVHS